MTYNVTISFLHVCRSVLHIAAEVPTAAHHFSLQLIHTKQCEASLAPNLQEADRYSILLFTRQNENSPTWAASKVFSLVTMLGTRPAPSNLNLAGHQFEGLSG